MLVALEHLSEEHEGRDAWASDWYAHAHIWVLAFVVLMGAGLAVHRSVPVSLAAAAVGAAVAGVLPADYRVPPGPLTGWGHGVLLASPYAAMAALLLANRWRQRRL